MSLFIFRRDLRVTDNTGLLVCIDRVMSGSSHGPIYLVFIFTKQQIGKENFYRSSNAIQFMINSLEFLSSRVKVNFYYGTEPVSILDEILEANEIKTLTVNRDYTPYSIKRDRSIEKWCKLKGIEFYSLHDAMLSGDHLEIVAKSSGKVYNMFTHFKNRVITGDLIRRPRSMQREAFVLFKELASSPSKVSLDSIRKKFRHNPHLIVKGTRLEAVEILKGLTAFDNYDSTRDYPFNPTTGLSAHNKFGTISPREVYYHIIDKLGSDSSLAIQMIWRDFYYYHLYHNIGNLENSFSDKRWDTRFKWNLGLEDFSIFSRDPSRFTKKEQQIALYKAWCEGRTGVPIVDAGMRQLNKTGYMHNRCRMIVAMFLTKNLMFHWKWGEAYFASQLTDYDPALNNGNWQWSSGTGVDPLRFGIPRIFNAWSQGEKSDPNAEYIKKWIPELGEIDPSDIHNWESSHQKYETVDYPKPIVSHDDSRRQFLEEFERVFKN